MADLAHQPAPSPDRPLWPILLFGLTGVAVGVAAAFSPVLGLLLIGLAGAGMMAFFPQQTLWLLVLLVPLLSGMRRFGPLRPNELLLIGCALLIGLAIAQRGRLLTLDRRLDPPIWLFLLFASVLPLIVYVARGNPLSTAIAPYLAPWQYYLIFRLTSGLVRSEVWARRLLQALLLAGAVLTVVGLLQALRVGPVVQLLQSYFPSGHLDLIARVGYRRTTSLLGNWHGAGVYYAFGLIAMAAAWAMGLRLFPRPLGSGLGLLLAAGLLSTNSFTAVGVALLGLLTVVVASRRVSARQLLGGGAVLLLGAALAGLAFGDWVQEQIAFQFSDFAYGYGTVERANPFLPRTVANRLISWEEQFGPVIRETWLLGYGPTLPNVGAQSDDSQYIYMLLKGGVGYVLAFFVLILALARAFWARMRRAAPGSWAQTIHLIGLALVIALTPAFFLQAYLTYSGVAEFLWIVAGVSSGLALAQGKR